MSETPTVCACAAFAIGVTIACFRMSPLYHATCLLPIGGVYRDSRLVCLPSVSGASEDQGEVRGEDGDDADDEVE